VLFDDERESKDKTPGLGSIPIIKYLFSRKGVQRNTNEILFFITPRISRPDYTATVQNGTGPRPASILQPVPMGNPPSNSGPQVENTQPLVLQSPALVRPDGMPVATPTPIKP
jgi:type II secretory pathway component GspD/PulD (secretin)